MLLKMKTQSNRKKNQSVTDKKGLSNLCSNLGINKLDLEQITFYPSSQFSHLNMSVLGKMIYLSGSSSDALHFY